MYFGWLESNLTSLISAVGADSLGVVEKKISNRDDLSDEMITGAKFT